MYISFCTLKMASLGGHRRDLDANALVSKTLMLLRQSRFPFECFSNIWENENKWLIR